MHRLKLTAARQEKDQEIQYLHKVILASNAEFQQAARWLAPLPLPLPLQQQPSAASAAARSHLAPLPSAPLVSPTWASSGRPRGERKRDAACPQAKGELHAVKQEQSQKAPDSPQNHCCLRSLTGNASDGEEQSHRGGAQARVEFATPISPHRARRALSHAPDPRRGARPVQSAPLKPRAAREAGDAGRQVLLWEHGAQRILAAAEPIISSQAAASPPAGPRVRLSFFAPVLSARGPASWQVASPFQQTPGRPVAASTGWASHAQVGRL